MRIAFVVTEFPALSETFVLNQITGFIDQGHDVEIHAGRPLKIEAHPEYYSYGLAERTVYRVWVPHNPFKRLVKAAALLLTHLHRAPLPLLRSLAPGRLGSGATFLQAFYEAVPFAGRPAYDALVCHFGENGNRVAELLAVGATRGRVLTFFHGADITRYVIDRGERVYDALFKAGALFLPISERWKKRLLELGCPPARIRIHHMGIDCGRFAFRPRRAQLEGSFRIVSVARLVEKKGLTHAIQALSQLRVPPGLSWHYEIIGDGPLMAELAQQVRALGLEGRVTLSGWRDQAYVVAALNEADVLAAPSVTAADGDQEGIPVALMEAMASGLPVISTYHSGIPELITDGVSGLLVPERDAAALGAAIERLMADATLRADIARGARAEAEAHWNIAGLNRRLAELCATDA